MLRQAPNLARLAIRALPPHWLSADNECGMLRPKLSTAQCVLWVPARLLLGSLTLVQVLVDENGEDVATSVHIQMPHAYTACCETTADGVDRFVALVPHPLDHLVALRAQLRGVVLAHLPEFYNACSSTMPCPNPNPLRNFPADGFHRAWESTPGHERGVDIRDNHGPLVTLELLMYNPITEAL